MMLYVAIIIFIFLLLLAIDWSLWKSMMGPGWNWWTDPPPPEEHLSDMQIRALYRRDALDIIPSVGSTD